MVEKRAYSHRREVVRKVFVWNRNRLIKEHGLAKGERLLRELPVDEAYRLWQKEGPGKFDIN